MLSDKHIDERRKLVNASEVHNIMAGYDDEAVPVNSYPPAIYEWIENKKPAKAPGLTHLRKELDCDVTDDFVKAAWKAYKHNTKPVNKGLITYANRLATKSRFDYDEEYENISTYAMRTGDEREPEAVDEFTAATGLAVLHTGDDQLHLTKDGVGATPDGIIKNGLDMFECGVEIKCRNPYTHDEQKFITDNASLKDMDFDRYCQVQAGMYVFDVQYWYSVNYNPNGHKSEDSLHWAIIDRDEDFIAAMIERVALVFEIKQKRIDQSSKIKRPPIRPIEGIIAA